MLPVKQILKKFPQNFSFCFAYGSGVKKQTGYTNDQLKDTLIDLMFCVDDAKQWHAENIKMNSEHYSCIKLMGASNIARVQEKFGAKVYCNTLVSIENGCSIKYGVISSTDLLRDLNDWTDLYVAGRLHKPVQILIQPNSPNISNALELNLKNAITSACLLLPQKFSYYDLFYQIAKLSYSGDFRMIFGENKDKVRNIVQPQLESFIDLYTPLLKKFSFCLNLPNKEYSNNEKIISQDKSSQVLLRHLQELPNNVICKLLTRQPKTEENFKLLANDANLQSRVAKSIESIVWRSSITQSIKNIPTAGLAKAFRYSWKKALKTFSK